MDLKTNAGGDPAGRLYLAGSWLAMRLATIVTIFSPAIELTSLTLSRTAEASYKANVLSAGQSDLRSALEHGTLMNFDASMPLIV